jgi:hypothetical protein
MVLRKGRDLGQQMSELGKRKKAFASLKINCSGLFSPLFVKSSFLAAFPSF